MKKSKTLLGLTLSLAIAMNITGFVRADDVDAAGDGTQTITETSVTTLSFVEGF